MNRIEFTRALSRGITALFFGAVLASCGGGGGGGGATPPGVGFSSVAGGCVRDNATGLIWEVKTTDSAAGGLRDWTKTYTNYDSTTSAQKFDFATGISSNPTQAEIDAPTNSVGFKNSVNAQGMCGFSDWRLPAISELESIIKLGSAPTIDTTWFPNTQPSFYWSASPGVGGGNNAWDVYFGNGVVNDDVNRSSFGGPVRLVRAGQ